MQEPIKKYIDLEKVIREKNPFLYKVLPRFILQYLKRIVHEDDLNRDISNLLPRKGVEFLDGYLDIYNLKTKVIGAENVPTDKRYEFVSNHPLGGPDGILFISAVNKVFPNCYFLVNDILMKLPGMEGCFLPLNLFGSNPRDYSIRINTVFESDSQILIFPAGLVSRKIGNKIVDLEWKKNFIMKAKKHKRDIVPVFIDDTNSSFFYNLAKYRKKLGIKANIEMLFLVDELYKHRDKTVTMYWGKPIPYTMFDNSRTPEEWAAYVKEIVYNLKK